jgi:hypothetical protein
VLAQTRARPIAKLGGASLPAAVEKLAREIKDGAPIPTQILIDTGQTDMSDLDEPTAKIQLTAVSGAVWSAVSSKAGVMTPAMLFFPLEGLAARLRARGSEIATELLAAPDAQS